MKLFKLINPFYILSFTFVLVLFLYTLGWSNLFTPLTFDFVFLILLLSFISFVIGKVISHKKIIHYKDLKMDDVNTRVRFPLVLILTLSFLNIYYSGIIPIFAGDIEKYESFGIPILDPFLLALLIFYSIFWWHCYLSFKGKKYIYSILITLILTILMARRSVLTYVIISNIYVFILYKKNISLKKIFFIVVLLLIFTYFFGFISTYKSGIDDDFIVNNMGATRTFYNLNIPNEYYNAYLYLCSPIANFYETYINSNYDLTFGNLILNEYIPDYFSNILYDTFNISYSAKGMSRVSDTLNVGTYFVGGYLYFGIIGIFLNLLYLIFFSFLVFKKLDKSNPYHITIVAFLCSLFAMCIFSNVFRILINVFVFIIPLFLQFNIRKKIIWK